MHRSQGTIRESAHLGVVGRLDRQIGDRLEQAVLDHHRRRLTKVGWEAALDPSRAAPTGGSDAADEGAARAGLWVAGDPPPRAGPGLEVLIDGAAALPRIAAAIEGARRSVDIAGWCVTPGFALRRDADAAVLRDMLARIAMRLPVRVLLWAGAPLPVFHPWRPEVRSVRRQLTRGTDIRVALDRHERPMHTHHEKLVIVDGEVAFVGGMDMTDFDGDRYDSQDHPPRGMISWHDVVTELHGPIVADVAAHFALRWAEVTGEPAPAPQEPRGAAVCGDDDVETQLVATIPESIYRSRPRGSFRILDAYVRALSAAQRLIYLENQFLWSPEIVTILRAKLVDPPSDGFRMLLVLPARPNTGGDDTRGQLAALIEADAGRHRVLACTLYAREGPRSWPIYVHAKVGVVDDRWLTVGSANLDDHSLFNDTEVNVVSCDERLARETRQRLWAEHLERPLDDVRGDPTVLFDTVWRPLAEEQYRRRQAGEPMSHRLARLPHVSRRSARLLGPLEGVFVDG